MVKKDVYELTNPQKSIWSTEQFYKGSSINNICGTALINEAVNFELLQKAILIVLNKNDIFKMQFFVEDGIAKQKILNEVNSNIISYFVENYSELDSIRDNIVSKHFNLFNSYLYNFYIFKMPNNQGAFMLNIHHLLADSWTLAFICNEIIKTYSLLKSDKPYNSELTYSYLDYISSENEYLNSDKFKKDKKYWNDKFQTIPETATIPSKSNKIDSLIDTTAKRALFELDHTIVVDLKNYCKKHKISLFNFFMAIYSIYISEITNLDDFVIGTPILNRTNYKEKHTAGMFINMAPFRINRSNINDFASFVKNIAINSMDMLKHQKYSYQLLLEDLRIKNKSIPNLYNILLSYQISNAKTTGENINYSTQWSFNGQCAEDIEIQIFDVNNSGNLSISYDYKTSLYDDKEIKNIHSRILYIINQVISNDNILLNDIEIVTPKEKQKLLYDFNNTNLSYNQNKPIIKYFEEQVEKTPNEPAIIFENKIMTYKELNTKANSLAYNLRKNGITNNSIVGILQDRSFELIISILAVLKSGGSYIPIAPDYPKERIEYMLNDSNAKLLLLNTDNNSIDISKPIINVNLNNNEIYNKNLENINNISKPDDLSYLIYTSGSTGTPKGVMLKQKNLTNLYNALSNSINYLKDKNCKKILSITTVSFDIFIFETLISLTKGLSVYMTNENQQKLSEALEKIISENQIEIMQTTPSVMDFHLKNIKNIENLSSLKYIMLAGEPLPEVLAKKLKKSIPGITIYNGYGPSETTVFSTVTDVTNQTHITIGKPIANTQIYILNKNKKLLPQGTIGEIYISGDGVGKGYINKPKQTEKCFIQNPFIPNTVMYKVGDLGSMDKKGEITCHGRIDHQVKIRGLRIELPEIEKQMLSINNISNAIVIKKQINNKDTLCAYYTSNEPVELTPLKLFLQSKLPQYMVPQYFIRIEKVPYTPNGKIDRKSLPDPTSISVEKEIIKPRNEIDAELIKLISKIINIKNISINDSLIDLGGDSLSAITLSTKILSKYNVQLDIKNILSNYTIQDMSDYIKTNMLNEVKSIRIEKAPVQEYYPLSSAQKRIYYTSKIIGDNNLVYNIPGAILINTILDKNKVKKCFEEIIKIQSSFRTSFVIYDNDIKQKVHKNIKFNIPIFNNENCDIKKLINNFSKPFSLENAPLLRVELHYIDNKKTLLLIESHHIIMDGTSLEILINDFCRVYNEENLEDLEIEYKDFAIWENKLIENNNIKDSENYWINKFKNVEIQALNLPYDYNIPSVRSYIGNTISSKFSASDFTKYINFAKSLGVSPYMFFIAVLFILLYKYTGQNEIIIGSPSTGRTTNQLNKIIGMFVNNIPVNAKIDSNEKFTEFLNNIKTQVLEDLMHQNYPYDLLVQKLNLSTDNSQNPLFDIMFAYQNYAHNKLTLNNKTAKIIKCDSKISKFNLTLEIDPETRVISIEYRTDLFKKETIERFLEHYINTLKSIVSNNEICIKDISIISNNELDLIINKFNSTKLKIPTKSNLPDLFRKVLKENYNNIAIITKDSYLTYTELDEKSNYLAMKLYAQGIRKGDVIGVCLNRSIELVISIWAILKLGAIYMPMYVNYPKDRLNYMLKNSNAKGLISNTSMSNIILFNGFKEIINSASEIKNSKELNIDYNILPNDIAYIIYTSGSTGEPKGVQITSRNLINYIYAFTKYFDNDIDNKDNFLSSTNISFDVSIFELFLPILNGAKLVLYEEEIISNIITYCNSIVENNITGLYIPPNILNEVYDILKNHNDININKLLVGVEPITKSTLNKYFNLNPNIKIINGYGPTETTICCTAFKYNKDDSNDDIISIGSALYNNQIFILDKDHNVQPIGITGEIYVTGYGVGAGYINKPIETRQNYQKNIFNNNSKSMYKTGDLAKWNLDGTINFIGRNDSQVKIAGHRIELKEINSILMQYPNINKAYTTIHKKGNYTYILSYFTAEHPIKKQDLTDFLKNKLADYMIPQFITQLDYFPLTVNGKIDKTKLPINIWQSKKDYIAPRNNIEKQIIKIWKNLFLLDKISIDDNFFELGGNSLTAIKFQIEAMNNGLNISYADIFSFPTPRQLSEKDITISKPLYQIDHTYDFTNINNILSINNTKSIKKYKIEPTTYKNILLVGATGFLGAHILDNYLSTQTGNIYCLIRKKSYLEPEDRLKKTLNFYFGNKYDNEFGKRIFVITGDITDFKFNLDTNSYAELSKKIDIVIHTAALVKHYGSYEQFKDINVIGTQNIVNFCKQFNKKLYYISTLSISGGQLTNKQPDKIAYFNESDFYIKQDLKNVYTYTKFEAEKLIYEEIFNGLSACVLRIGNITNRYTDGKFQINASENAFYNRIKSVLSLGVVPQKLLTHSIEFTPVDSCSDAIIKIVMSNPKFTTFHLFNNNFIILNNLLDVLNSLDIHLTPVSDNEFSDKINFYLNNKDLKNEISGIITDLNKNKQLNLINNILPNSEFTQNYLKLINFEWPKINSEYIKKYISYLKL